MSTNGAIAVPSSSGNWAAVYHHWDSYPSGLGAQLWKDYHGHFNQNLDDMQRVLIDEHRAGWSTIVDCNWSHPIGWSLGGNAPKCYCHGERDEPICELAVCDCSGKHHCKNDHMTWVYVLNDETLDIWRWSTYAGHIRVATIPWDADEPDWKSFGY